MDRVNIQSDGSKNHEFDLGRGSTVSITVRKVEGETPKVVVVSPSGERLINKETNPIREQFTARESGSYLITFDADSLTNQDGIWEAKIKICSRGTTETEKKTCELLLDHKTITANKKRPQDFEFTLESDMKVTVTGTKIKGKDPLLTVVNPTGEKVVDTLLLSAPIRKSINITKPGSYIYIFTFVSKTPPMIGGKGTWEVTLESCKR